jgi:hypothetical protein
MFDFGFSSAPRKAAPGYDLSAMVNGHASSTWGLCSLALLLGCATAPPMTGDDVPVSQGPPATRPRPAPPRAQRSKTGEAANVANADALVGLCGSLRDEPTADFAGNAVEQARASAAHADRRQAALAGSYVAVVPAGGFSFRNYQIGERRLVLDTDRTFVLGEGAELFASSRDTPPGFSLEPDLAERLLAERSTGQLSLRLVFRPAHSELRKDGCMWLSGGNVVKMEIDIVAAALLGSDGAIVARGDTGEYGDPTAGLPVRSPKVTVKKTRDHLGKDVPDGVAGAFTPLSTAVLPCYQRVLIVRPALRGTLVLAIRVGGAGKLDDARVEISSLGDDAVSACVITAANKTSLPGLPAGRFSVPLLFGSADER